MVFVFISLAVLVGSMAQRVAGMGFALTTAPILVLLIGPFDGVLLVNLAGAASALIVFSRVWRNIDWRQFRHLTVPALLAIIPGAYVSVLLGGSTLQITVGVIVVVLLTISLFINSTQKQVARRPAAILSGAASGFMSATAGVGGPGAGVYAVLTRWEHRQFAATVQPFFFVLGMMSFITKVVLSDQGLPDYEWWVWPLVMVCTLVGIVLGGQLAHVVSVRVARITVIVISYLGGGVAIINGTLAAIN